MFAKYINKNKIKKICIIGIIIFILLMIVSCNSTYDVYKGRYDNFTHKEELVKEATDNGCNIVQDVSCCMHIHLICKRFTFIHTYGWIGSFDNHINIKYK